MRAAVLLSMLAGMGAGGLAGAIGGATYQRAADEPLIVTAQQLDLQRRFGLCDVNRIADCREKRLTGVVK